MRRTNCAVSGVVNHIGLMEVVHVGMKVEEHHIEMMAGEDHIAMMAVDPAGM